ncbi:MAG: DUF6067 family protein [Bacteroidota bacterium]|nr:DUF6067 family protein [Bacteroidota bacterium]
MKNLLLFTISFILLNSCKEPVKLYIGFPEPDNPEYIDPALWDQVESDLHASFVSVDERYDRDIPPEITINDSWEGVAWRGEKIHTQFLIWTNEDVPNIHWDISNLKDNEGNVLNSGSFEIRAVRYVLTDDFLTGCGYRDSDTIQAHIVADMLEPIAMLNLPARSTRPIWITVDIPENQKPGTYKGGLNLHFNSDSLKTLNISIKVQDKILPPPSDWSFHLDLWQNPFAVARFHDVPLWSQQHWDLLKPLLTMLAEAGQKCITTSIIPAPWGGQTFDPFESMIGWIYNSSGKWEYDYSIFDQYVQFAMNCGITQQINCYSMVPWGNQVSYFNEDSSRFVRVKLIPGTEEYENIWRPFLFDFRAHLKEMGWLDKTTIALDERGIEEMKALFSFMKETTPEFKITMAGHYFEEINHELYDFSYNWMHVFESSKEVADERRKKGAITTYYVACGIPKPNNFSFSPPAESAYEGWFAAAMGFDGFLRWAYNSWVEDPLMDTRFRTWPAGDTYFVYPGARNSIRFERLREGIQDYEKIRILQQESFKNGSQKDKIILEEIDEFLNKINRESLQDKPAAQWVNEGKELLEKLSEEAY